MNDLIRVNKLLIQYPYIINYAIKLDENNDGTNSWTVRLELSDNKLLYGKKLKIVMRDVSDLKVKTPNIGLCGVFQVTDVKKNQMENKHFFFEDSEERMISCYSNHINIENDNEIIFAE